MKRLVMTKFQGLVFFLSFLFFSCSEETRKVEEDPAIDPVDPESCVFLSSVLSDDAVKKLALFNSPKNLIFFDKASKSLEEEIPSFIDYKVVPNDWGPSPLGSNILEFGFFYDEIPLCSEFTKVYGVENQIFLTGSLPKKNLEKPSVLQKPFFQEKALKALKERLETEDVSLKSGEKPCYAIKDKKLIPVWKVKVLREKKPYEALIHESQILSLRALFFNETGKIITYDENDLDSPTLAVKSLKTYKVDGLSSEGLLCSERFRFVAEDNEPLAKRSDFIFDYDPVTEADLFDQASIFYSVTNISNYIKSLDFVGTWPGPQIELILDSVKDGLTNSAQYIPSDGKEKSQIRLPKGDGSNLKNIRRDNEAAEHEALHQNTYRTLQSTTGESLVLHEAFSDIFVMLRTRNPCLGEHLCVNDSICVSTECLRTADNDYTLTSRDLPSQAHLKSQLVSGLLWDIALVIGFDELANWLNYTISFLPRTASFEIFSVAMFNALKSLDENGNITSFSAYCEALMTAYNKRGFNIYAAANNLRCSI